MVPADAIRTQPHLGSAYFEDVRAVKIVTHCEVSEAL